MLAAEKAIVLTRYLAAAMRQADYQQLADGSWWGRIPGFKGLWADGASREECRAELASALEDWVLFSLRRQRPVPTVDGIDLAVTEVG
jgi:predicted RNase H-like HicB family nuclease